MKDSWLRYFQLPLEQLDDQLLQAGAPATGMRVDLFPEIRGEPQGNADRLLLIFIFFFNWHLALLEIIHISSVI